MKAGSGRRGLKQRVLWLLLVSSLPPLVILLMLLVHFQVSVWLVLLTALLGAIAVMYINHRLYGEFVYQFRSLSNLLDALIQGDYSLRGRQGYNYREFDELIVAINRLAERLSEQRQQSAESELLVKTVIEHIDVAIVALTEDNKISFLNRAAKDLLQIQGVPAESQIMEQLEFVKSSSSGNSQAVELSFGYVRGKFSVHMEEFREAGIQHKLLFITDVSILVRSEERKAWQRLVRVLGHEINNSLAPIKSLAQTLSLQLFRQDLDSPNSEQLKKGLRIIGDRAESLGHFVKSYERLAIPPSPNKTHVSIVKLAERLLLLFKGQPLEVNSDQDYSLYADPSQIEQVLINLTKNALEAMAQSEGVVAVSWCVTGPWFRIMIKDQGCGIRNPGNLFVPFYSTKQGGSGIGLVLSRQIVEAHGGRLSLENRQNSRGCCATIEVPFEPH